MYVIEMHTALDVRLQKIDTNAYLDIKPEIKDYYLNTALIVLVKRDYAPKGGTGGFEETGKRIEDLRDLVVPISLTTSGVGPDDNGQYFNLPPDYWFSAREEINVVYTDYSNTVINTNLPVTPVTHDRWNKIRIDPFNVPWEEECLRLSYSSQNEVISGDNIVLGEYQLVYVKRPKILIYDTAQFANSIFNIAGSLLISDFVDVPEVANEIHNEIIDLAETMILDAIQSPRFNTNFNELVKRID